MLDENTIRSRLQELQPNVAWCHYYDFGHGVESVSKDNEPYYTKAFGLKKIGQQVLASIPHITKKGDIKEQTVLDLACAEGVHSNEFAKAGAKRVVGLEGRQLYVDRSNFAKDALGLTNVEFVKGDVRHISPDETGTFDIVLFFGILHHLDASDWLPMLKSLRAVTNDTMVLYTHTSEEGCLNKFAYKLSDELVTDDGYHGRFYREHPDDADEATRIRRNRNSLDNTFSFWPREDDLIRGLRDAGFDHISRQMWPNPFGRPSGEFRVLYVCH
ncbi:MAG: class I SAM-dependent methyltransferase [Pseudomonadota bacterium]